MKTKILIVLVVLSSVGCESLKRLPGLDSPHSVPNSDAPNVNDFYVNGTTTKDHQSVYTPVTGRTLTVEVLRPGASEWVMLERVDPPYNPYQLFTIPTEGVYFGDRAERETNGGLHVWTGTPAAPTGTQYRIHNVKNI